MIAKGGSRSGPKQLGNYLMRVGRYATGEQAELIELRSPWSSAPNGTPARAAAKLVEAFRDWQTIAEATQQGEYGLYHAQISPAPKYAQRMTAEQWKRAADILAEELGLEKQDRAVVLHAGKDERPHLHVVWGRCDIDTMKLISDSHNFAAHERASARMELEFGQDFVPGKHAKRDREKQPEFPREAMSMAEAQQAARLDMTKEERIAELAGIRKSCDDGLAFKNALQDAGYLLAKGDQRGFVLVDRQGETYSLTKFLPDLKGKDFKAFMAPVDRDALPSVDEAKAVQEVLTAAAQPEPPAEAQKQPPEASKFLTPEVRQSLEQPTPAPPEGEKPAIPLEVPLVMQQEPEDDDYGRVRPPEPEQDPSKFLPPEDPEVTALKRKIAKRQSWDARKWAEYDALEYKQKNFELRNEKAWKLEDFYLLQQTESEALFEKLRERRKGVWGVIDAINSKLNPTDAAEKAAARQKEIEQFKARQKVERRDYIALLEQSRQMELDALKERQAAAQAKREIQYAEDRDRYLRERLTAKQIMAEQEARRRQEEIDREQGKDGPPRKGK